MAVVFLVDPRGRVLMQHRDASAKTSPNQWGMPGGRIEEGEEPVEAARREVLEETGLTVTELEHFFTGTRPSVNDPAKQVEVFAFCAATDATQDDIVLGEGQAMVFLEPHTALSRDLGVTGVMLLPKFLVSEQYARLSRR